MRETRCVWLAPSEDPNARYLIPGCMERVLDWDAECTCKTTAEQVDELQARIADLERQLRQSRDAHQALMTAVGRHPGARPIFAAADQISAEWREQIKENTDA